MAVLYIRINISSLMGKKLSEDLDQINNFLKEILNTEDIAIKFMSDRRYEMVINIKTRLRLKNQIRYKITEKILELNKEFCEIGFVFNNSLYVAVKGKKVRLERIL